MNVGAEGKITDISAGGIELDDRHYYPWHVCEITTPQVDWLKVPMGTQVHAWDGDKPKEFNESGIKKLCVYLPNGKYPFQCFDNGYGQSEATTIIGWKHAELVSKRSK